MRLPEAKLAAVAKNVLEMMAFTFEKPGDYPGPCADAVRARVGFRGPCEGWVEVTTSRAVIGGLAANMLGQDDGEPPGEQQQLDALGELANIICGNLVQEFGGPAAVFNLTAPQMQAGPPPSVEAALETVTRVKIPLEEGWLEATLVVTTPVPAPSAASAPDDACACAAAAAGGSQP
ncbi:MAG TPA: chemotaxis protein CheX [Phycisphaerae bacterium]|nr:chemotaxis protein CheX [Phycisphaerae bacterium]